MKKLNGFTLVELMVVIVIIGILAAVAIPKFALSINKSRAVEATNGLSLMATAEHIYFAENGRFVGVRTEGASTGAISGGAKDVLGLDLTHGTYFKFGTASRYNDTAFYSKAFIVKPLGDNEVDRWFFINGYGYTGGQTQGMVELAPSFTQGRIPTVNYNPLALLH